MIKFVEKEICQKRILSKMKFSVLFEKLRHYRALFTTQLAKLSNLTQLGLIKLSWISLITWLGLLKPTIGNLTEPIEPCFVKLRMPSADILVV